MCKPNRAHYRLDQNFLQDGWAPSGDVLCVFHARRLPSSGFRAVALKVGGRGMSRPVEQSCSECLKHVARCEHDAQNVECPRIHGDTCGRDNGDELGGSW
jgi:hypothetical protein